VLSHPLPSLQRHPLWLLLLDIRRGKSVQFMAHPNLNIVDKNTVQVEFNEEDE
jgi:hypothetical protein